MNGPMAMSALSPFDSQLRTFVGTARGSHLCHGTNPLARERAAREGGASGGDGVTQVR